MCHHCSAGSVAEATAPLSAPSVVVAVVIASDTAVEVHAPQTVPSSFSVVSGLQFAVVKWASEKDALCTRSRTPCPS